MRKHQPATCYRFKKPGFAKHQSFRLADPKKRRAILIDRNILSHPRIMRLLAEDDSTLFPMLVHIWAQLDLASEAWVERSDSFNHWARQIFSKNNRYDPRSRLKKLAELGLVEFEEILFTDLPEKEDPPSQSISNDPSNASLTPLLKGPESDPNTHPKGETLPFRTPLEPSKTPSLSDDIHGRNKEKKTSQSINPTRPDERTLREEDENDFLRELLTVFEKSGNSFHVESLRPGLVNFLKQTNHLPDQIRQAWLTACKVASENGARTPRYLLKVFEDKLTVQQNDVSHASSLQYLKDGDGRYTFNRDFDPSTDPSIPFSELSFDCMTRRLTVAGLLVNFKPNMERLDNEDLQLYINEAIHQDSGFQTFFSEAIEAIGRMG
jgi:hypothetical protein